MPAKKTKSTSSKSVWGKNSKENIDRSLANASALANPYSSKGNIGDSLESRLGPSFLGGGGSDVFDGGLGYYGEFLGQSMYGGEESTIRGAQSSSPLSRGGIQRQQETRYAWNRIKITNSIYENDGQVSSIIDLMADFATDGLRFTHSQDSVQKFYDAWMQKVKLKSRFRNAIINLLISGNVFLYRIYAKLDKEEKDAMKSYTVGQKIGDKLLITKSDGTERLIDPKIVYDSAVQTILEASAGEKVNFDDDYVREQVKEFVKRRLNSDGEKIVDKTIKIGEENVVPWKYVALNPLQIVPDENGSGWKYLLTREEVAKLLNSVNISFDESANSIKVSMPDGITGNIKKTNTSSFFAEMKLDDERVVVLHYGKADWQRWGFGLVWKAMPTITFKNTLRNMEIKTAKAAINTVFLWQLGDHKEGLIPNLEDYERLADMLKAPASTLNVIWNSAIKCDVVQPKISEIFDVKRWEELRKEVTSQFGITQSVVTGEGGNFSSSFISVQGLLEKLQTLRDMLVEEWLLEEALIIHKAMSFRKLPRVRFGAMTLRDKTAEDNFIMGLYDRGLISDESMYEVLERDSDIERERLLNERTWEDENNFDRRGPFIKDPEQHVLDEKTFKAEKEFKNKEFEMRDKELEHSKEIDEKKMKEDFKLKKVQLKETLKMKKQQLKMKKPNGRPPGSGKPLKNKRPSKPKNIARVDLEDVVEILDNNAKKFLVSKAGVADYRSLSKEDKLKVIDLVGVALAELDNVGPEKVIGDTFISDGLTSSNNEYLKECLERAVAFSNEHGRRPTKDEMYKIYIDSWYEV